MKTILQMRCREVIREISNFIDGETGEQLRASMEAHLEGCAHCTAILDGTRNVLKLYADGRSMEIPGEFGARLFDRLKQENELSGRNM
jgi:hypothetical protein